MSSTENKDAVRRWFTETRHGGVDEQAFTTALERTISRRFVDHDGPDPERGHEVIANASLPVARHEPRRERRHSFRVRSEEGGRAWRS
jgi:hypothetical protein